MPASLSHIKICSPKWCLVENLGWGIEVVEDDESKPVCDFVVVQRGKGDMPLSLLGFPSSHNRAAMIWATEWLDLRRHVKARSLRRTYWERVIRHRPGGDLWGSSEWADTFAFFREQQTKRMPLPNHDAGPLIREAWSSSWASRRLGKQFACCCEGYKKMASSLGAVMMQAMHERDCRFFDELRRTAHIVCGDRRKRGDDLTIEEKVIKAAVLCLKAAGENPDWEVVKATAVSLGAATSDWSTVQKRCRLQFLGTGKRGRRKIGTGMVEPVTVSKCVELRPMTKAEERHLRRLQPEDELDEFDV